MKIAYFDCFSGASGDMILAAFLDAGLDAEYLKRQLRKLLLSGYSLNTRKVKKLSLAATAFDVSLVSSGCRPKSLKDIRRIINKSALALNIKELSCKIFDNLAAAECTAHGWPPLKSATKHRRIHRRSSGEHQRPGEKNDVHFHELGDTDSIVDIVGTAIALDYFKVKKVYSSPINVGSGLVRTAHGILPIPAPVTSVLLKGLPVYSEGRGWELTTPTGAVILKTVCDEFGQMPLMEIERAGLGAGTFNIKERPNILRVFIGNAAAEKYASDNVTVVETNIDDMNPVAAETVMKRIFKAGALDVYFMPVYTKKTRVGILLSAITERKFLEPVLKTIFRETTTFGVRTYETTRYKLDRVVKTVRLKYGSARVKIGRLGDSIVSVSPEYEDCRRLSEQEKAPFRDVYDEIKCAYKKKARNEQKSSSG